MREPQTARPPFDPAEFAKEAESRLQQTDEPASRRDTPRAFPAAPLTAGAFPNERGASGATTSPPTRSPDGDRIPVLIISREELEWFALSPTASRLIAQLDGISPIAAVCSGANLPWAEGQRILLELSEQGIVAFR